MAKELQSLTLVVQKHVTIVDFLSLLPVLASLVETTQGQPESTLPGGWGRKARGRRQHWQLFSMFYPPVWQSGDTAQQRNYLSLPLFPNTWQAGYIFPKGSHPVAQTSVVSLQGPLQ